MRAYFVKDLMYSNKLLTSSTSYTDCLLHVMNYYDMEMPLLGGEEKVTKYCSRWGSSLPF